MEQENKKKPSNLKVVICVILFVLIASLFMSSGIFSPNAGAVTALKMDENNIKDIIFKRGDSIYKVSIGQDPVEINESELKTEEKSQLGDVLYFGEDDKYSMALEEDGIYFQMPGEEVYELDVQNIDINTISFSPDEKAFMFIADKKLYVYSMKNEKINSYIEVDENVDEAHFTINNDFVYLKGTSLTYASGGYKKEIEKSASKLIIPKDNISIYYIKNYDENSGGTLVRFQVGGKKQESGDIDESVKDLFYCGADYLAYIKNGVLHIAHKIETSSLEIHADELGVEP